MKIERIIALLLLFSFFVYLPGCASPAPDKKKEKIEIVWPLPPEKPRIRYIDTIKGASYFPKIDTLAKALFGEEKVPSFIKPYGVAVDGRGRIYATERIVRV